MRARSFSGVIGWRGFLEVVVAKAERRAFSEVVGEGFVVLSPMPTTERYSEEE